MYFHLVSFYQCQEKYGDQIFVIGAQTFGDETTARVAESALNDGLRYLTTGRFALLFKCSEKEILPAERYRALKVGGLQI